MLEDFTVHVFSGNIFPHLNIPGCVAFYWLLNMYCVL